MLPGAVSYQGILQRIRVKWLSQKNERLPVLLHVPFPLLLKEHGDDQSSEHHIVNPVAELLGKERMWKKTVTVYALTMGELQPGKLEVKPNDLRLKCSDIHATTQHILLDSMLFLSNTIPFVGMLPGSPFLV